ncbi:hypothetical protein [Clostridium estertheticum]|uniref:hypothetical protein n=1 Tax=Clostridium estertheticum TaxID=238834 RepID=UPI001C7DB2AA|nr:hypothetical protein [Clostridium estertheticum]MBX4264447.1 hypothetical protein [Clostridium estertheticum]WLC89289.1 hypothetical protein KTC95_03405 [Clostridium estertheticum]
MMEKVDIVNKDIITSDSIQFKGATLDYDSNCATGDKDYLLPKLAASLKKAKTIDMAVGFLMESGVKLLINDLKLVAQSGVRIRILTGNYLNITQPQALFLNHSIIIDDDDDDDDDDDELRYYSSVWKRSKIFNTLEKVEDNKDE